MSTRFLTLAPNRIEHRLFVALSLCWYVLISCGISIGGRSAKLAGTPTISTCCCDLQQQQSQNCCCFANTGCCSQKPIKVAPTDEADEHPQPVFRAHCRDLPLPGVLIDTQPRVVAKQVLYSSFAPRVGANPERHHVYSTPMLTIDPRPPRVELLQA